MPWTTGFCIVGAASISAFPLFSGFVSKSLILTAAAENGYWIPGWCCCSPRPVCSSIPASRSRIFAFFAHDSGIRCKEAPWNMLLAMAITASLCIGIGVYPAPLYALLPYPVDYEPYTASHVITQLQLLMFSALAFSVLMRTGLYPPELRLVNLDTDWVYRRALPAVIGGIVAWLTAVRRDAIAASVRVFDRFMVFVFHYHGPHGVLARTWPIGGAVIWVLVLLAGFLIVYYR